MLGQMEERPSDYYAAVVRWIDCAACVHGPSTPQPRTVVVLDDGAGASTTKMVTTPVIRRLPAISLYRHGRLRGRAKEAGPAPRQVARRRCAKGINAKASNAA
jgi:hypothetical protein